MSVLGVILFRIQSECGKNTDQYNSELGHVSRSEPSEEGTVHLLEYKLFWLFSSFLHLLLSEFLQSKIMQKS